MQCADHSIPNLERVYVLGESHHPAAILMPKNERVLEVMVLQIKTVALQEVHIRAADSHKCSLIQDMPWFNCRDGEKAALLEANLRRDR